MPTPTPGEDAIKAFAALPRSILEDIVEVARRFPPEWWGDVLADLKTAESRSLPGCITQDLHHDARGIVHANESTTKRRRQRTGRG